MLEKIVNLLKTGSRSSIELAYQLSLSNKLNLWPIERELKDLLFYANNIQAPIQFDKLPLGQLCYVLKEVIALEYHNSTLEALPDRFDFMPALVILEINCTSLTVVGKSIEQLSKLKSLSIKNTQIRTLPIQLSLLTDLESLNISYNQQLESLPKDIYACSKLEKLRVCKNTARLVDLKKARFELIICS